MIDLRKKEDVFDVNKHYYFIVYSGKTPKIAAKALNRKSAIKEFDRSEYYFSCFNPKEGKEAIAKANAYIKKMKGVYEFDGSFRIKDFNYQEWNIIGKKMGRTVKFESTEKETDDMIDLREKKVNEKFDIDKEFDKVMKRFNKEKKELPGKTDMDKIDYILSSSDYNDDEYDSLHDRIEDYLGNDESCNDKKTEAEDEIKFVNKGEKFKSDKADDVEIIDIDKGDDKTTVTYKLGSEEKKGDIEDVIKMLNGAEYKKVDDKKEACSKKEDDEEEPEEEPTDDAEKQDESVEVTLTEDFHVPGTDIVLEKGDVIRIIPRQN